MVGNLLDDDKPYRKNKKVELVNQPKKNGGQGLPGYLGGWKNPFEQYISYQSHARNISTLIFDQF